MFCEREQFKSDKAFELYKDAIAFAHAPGSCVFNKYEAFGCTCKALGMLLMAREIEPNNPHIAWMYAWIIDFDYHSTDFLIDVMNKTLTTFENAKDSGEYSDVNYNHISKPIKYGLGVFIEAKKKGLLMTK